MQSDKKLSQLLDCPLSTINTYNNVNKNSTYKVNVHKYKLYLAQYSETWEINRC